MMSGTRQKGFTLAELLTVVAIIGLLAAMVVPVARLGLRRQREIELRERIRKITDAVDRFHDLKMKGQIKDIMTTKQGDYPDDLDQLIKGVETLDGKKVKFLRERDLMDPMTGEKQWFTRSNTDDFDSISSNNDNVFDVHSKSTQLSLDGKTRYNEW
ncbi:MAG TPA: type II secretion system protein [Thermoanaerobaculia bacterium]|nr:type II secretion system protein [Thermoanaerobaculia bacterium]